MSAQNTTTHNVEVTDNGSTANVIKNIETLVKSLKAAQQQASATFTASTAAPTPGGTAGSRAAAQGMMSGSVYGTLRATGAGTGAASRDFAKESQGLGGLVRLYATYAANIFAVSAAFSALSKAMDTTNMVRGLDQLGASSGRSLGALSKRVVDLTDGAISLQEAMTAVAQSSSAGLSGKNIERLAVVAKNASLALGISMPDALSRLSRGVTKLEPELLDELGIFTKIEPAVDTYARQLNKAASQLTDFEKRQAFANAVIKEGEDKFSSLAELAANPYDKLLASLKNLSQNILEVVNKVLGPFVELLSSSPTLLGTAIAGLSLALVKQALPAIGQFKEELRSSADFAAELAKSKAADAEVARNKVSALIEREAERRADIQVQAVEDAEARMNELRKKGYAKDSATAKALAKDLDDVGPKDYKKMEAEAQDYAKKGLHAEAEAVRDVSFALQQSKKAEHELRIEKAKNIIDIENEKTGRSQLGLTIAAADAAQIESTKRKIVSDAAYNTSLIGMSHSWTLLKADIDASGLALTKFDKAMLMLRGSAGIAIGVLTSLGAALNAALGWIGLIITAFSLLDALLSKNAKEMSAFDSAVDQSDNSLKNMIRTLEVLAKKGGFTGASIEGISALANSVGEANDTLEKLIATSEKAKDSLADSRWARIKDFFASLVGGGVENNFAEGVAKQVTGSLQIFERAGIGEQAQEKFKKALGVTSLDFKTVEEAAKSLDKEGLQNLQKTTNELSTELNNSSSRLQSFKAASDTALKSYQDFLKSTASTNPLFKLGDNIQALGEEMAKLKKEGVDELQAGLIDLAINPKKAGLFSQEFFNELKLARQGFLDQVKTVELYKDSLTRVQGDMAKLKKLLPENYDFMNDPDLYRIGARFDPSGRGQAVEQLKSLAKQEADLKLVIQIPNDKAEQIEKLWSKGVNDALIQGADYIKKALGESSERAAITIAKAQSSVFTGAEKARIETRLNQRELDIQLRLVNSNIDLILQGERNTAATEALTAALALDTASRGGVTGKELDKLRNAAIATQVISNKLGMSGKDKSNFETPAGLDPEVEQQIRFRLERVRRQVAEQEATRTEIKGKKAAESFTGGVNVRKGQLEDAQQLENIELSINAAKLQQLQTTQSIVGYATNQSINAQSILEFANNEAKRKQEIAKIDQDIDNVKKASNSKDKESQLKKLEALKTTTLQKQEEEARLENEKTLVQGIQAELDLRNRNREVAKADRDLGNERITSQLEVTSALNSAYASLFENSKEYTNSLQNQNELAKINQNYTSKKAEEEQSIADKRADAEFKLGTLSVKDTEARAEITKELQRQEKLSQRAIDRLEVEKWQREDILQITKLQQKAQLEIEKINKRIELEKSSVDLRNTIANNALQLERARFEVVKALANENDQYIIKEQYALDLKEAQVLALQKIDAIETDLNNKRILSQAKINAEIVRGASEEDVTKLQAGENLTLGQQGQKATNEILALQSGLQLRTETLEIQKKQALEQAKYNQLLALGAELSTELKDTFGLFGDKVKAVGESLGDMITKLTERSVREEKFAKRQQQDEKKLSELKASSMADEDQIIDLQNKIADDKKKNTKDELKGDLAAISSTKKMFKEKTLAYKLFAATEKALALVQIATNAMLLASKLSTEAGVTAAENAGTAARMPAYITNIWGQTLGKLPPPYGAIVGAGLVALLLAAFGKGGTKTSAAGFQMNTEQRQETQGTGSTYIPDPTDPTKGKLVETRGGVFGDSSAKVDSIRKGIEIIAATSVEGLDYDNKMLKALNKLSDAMTGAAQEIYSIPGLRQGGTAFGTQPGTSTIGGPSTFAKIMTWPFGGLANTIFGGKTTATASVQSAGIQLQGTFQQIIDDTANSIKQYKDVLYQFHKSGGWFSSSKDWTEIKRETESVTDDVRNSIADIFKESKTLFQTIGEKSGVTAQQVQDAFSKNPIDLSIDFTKLTGDEIVTALNAAIGKELNLVAEELFSTFTTYKKFGETLLETVIRVTDTNEKINQALVNIRGGGNSSVNEFSQQFTEALASIAGGLDVFLDRVDYFRQNFLTKAEQLAPVKNSVDKEMTRLGFSAVKTVEDFKYLIQNFRITDQATMQTYVALLNVAEGFQKVYGAGKSLVEIEDERLSLQQKVIELNSTTAQLREIEISKLSTVNQVYQRQINAITDYQTAAKAYQTSLQNTTKTLASQITTLNDYRSGLMSGANTTLTATEQYASAKSEMESLVATIKDSKTTEADRNTAVGKLSGVTDKFLGLSKQLYASGAQYSTDFNTVLNTVDEVTTKLGTQKTAAELQLSELESSNNFLQSIEESTKTTADLLKELNLARTTRNNANAAATTASATSVANSANTALFNNVQVAGGTAATQRVHAGGWILDPVAGWVYVSDVSYDAVQTAIDSARAVITTGVAAAGTASAGAIFSAGTANANAITTAGNTLNNTINGLPPIIATSNQNMVDALGKKFDEAIDRLIDAVDNNTEATVVVTTQVGENQANATIQAAATQANTLRNTTSAYATMKRGESGGTTEL